MCMIDDGESLANHSAVTRVARKAHTCHECGREIAPGETYEFAKGIMEGGWFQFKTCGHCIAVRTWLTEVCGGYCYESVGDDLRQHFRDGYGLWLGRAAAGMRRKWRRFDGDGLMPVMTLPAVLPTGDRA